MNENVNEFLKIINEREKEEAKHIKKNHVKHFDVRCKFYIVKRIIQILIKFEISWLKKTKQ